VAPSPAPSLDPISPWAFREGKWRRVAQLASSAALQDAKAAASGAARSSSSSPLTLLTWNVWFGQHKFEHRTAALLDELAWRAPDVIALQEVTEELLEILVAHPHLRATYQLTDIDTSTFDNRSHYGVLLLSKVPFARAGLVHLPSQMGRRLLVAELTNGLCVATVHLESMKPHDAARAEQLELAQRFLAGYSDDVVLMGDMNFSPGAPREDAVRDASFLDAWAELHPLEPGYSVDSQRNDLRRRTGGGEHVQKRIDRVFVRSARWQAQAISLTGTSPIDTSGTFVSDHFGLETVLEPRPS
jgi:tyrosyl-DNA phosphodiesterase 2